MSTIIYHNHHIIPRYRCKEIGIDPEFPENLIRLTEQEHAQAHYERWLRYQRKEDLWAAVAIGKRKIDGHSTKGENSVWYGKKRPPFTEEHKRRMSESHKGEKNFNYGRNFSPEHKKKIGDAQRGKIISEETRKKLSIAGKGRKQSPEEKKMRSVALSAFHAKKRLVKKAVN